MFSSGIPKLFIIFVLYSMLTDIRCALKMKENKKYNNFELASGSYADIAFLVTISIVILYFLKFDINYSIISIILNIVLGLVYCGMFKILLQKVVRTKYFWVDTKQEEKDIRKINRKRTGLLFNYFIFMLFFRDLALTIVDGISNNIFAIIGTLWFAMRASKKCAKIKNRINTEEKKASSEECSRY